MLLQCYCASSITTRLRPTISTRMAPIAITTDEDAVHAHITGHAHTNPSQRCARSSFSLIHSLPAPRQDGYVYTHNSSTQAENEDIFEMIFLKAIKFSIEGTSVISMQCSLVCCSRVSPHVCPKTTAPSSGWPDACEAVQTREEKGKII